MRMKRLLYTTVLTTITNNLCRYILNTEANQDAKREWVGGDENCWKMTVKGIDGVDDKNRLNVVYFEDTER